MATISMTLPVYRPLELDVQKPEYQILQQVYGRQGETALTIRATITDDGQPYDFSGKKIVLFATSGGSGFGKTVDGLKGSVASDTVITEGRVLNGSHSTEELKEWVDTL